MALFLWLFPLSSSVQLPGVAPRDYAEGQPVKLRVQEMTSVRTQLPMDFYKTHNQAGQCRPDPDEDDIPGENLGELLSGGLLEPTVYDLAMKVDKTCAVACKEPVSKELRQRLKQMIQDQ